MRRSRILHVIPTLDRSGSEKQLALLASRLPRERFEVGVCALTRGGPYAELLAKTGVDVEVIGKRLKADPFALDRLVRFVRRWNPDLVQTWLFAGNCYGRVAAALRPSTRIVATERCVDSWKAPHELAIDRYLARWTDRVVANSLAVADFYARKGIDPAKLTVITNGIEPSTVGRVDRAGKLAELGIETDRLVIGFVGRLWPQKRVKDLVWAMDVLRLGNWPVECVIIGEGPQRAALRRFARQLEVHEHVHFLGNRDDVADWMRVFDVLVLPSQFEGMPNVVLEAMQAGCPVVAARIPGMEEVVDDGVTGVLYEVGRPFELAKSVVPLLGDPELRRSYGEAGRQRIHESFGVERMTSEYERLYLEVLGRPR